MIYKFKFYGHYFAVDTESGAVHQLTDIQYDMLTYLRFPFEEVFPTTLRYDLAKYESSKLKEAYFQLKKLSDDGVFMSKEPKKLVKSEKKDTLSAEKTVIFDAKRFVFASEVIKSADSGISVISAEENKENPVKESDYDILFSEYERVAKEIIKRKSGRVDGRLFDFVPFDFTYEKDELGYFHITEDEVLSVFEDKEDCIEKKCAELSVAIFLE